MTSGLLFIVECFHFIVVNSFVNYFGYGNVAGYLFQRGIMTNPEGGSTLARSRSTSHIDPITGEIRRDEEENPFAKMTDEEKEQEAERFFVLFEKLNATGVIKATFPETE